MKSARKCCGSCIGDRSISRDIIPMHAHETGNCPRCGTAGQRLVEPHTLRDVFDLVLGIYTPSAQGDSLYDLLKQDWALFDNERMDEANALMLLADILDDGERVRQLYVASGLNQSNALERWDDFRRELMHTNRFFLKTEINLERLRQLLSHLVLRDEDIPEYWFRARIQDGDAPFSSSDMGAPPTRKASHGRANPAGIPYLYLASNAATAVSELRPHTGEAATVARFTIPRGSIRVVDLTSPRKTVSPFILEDQRDVALLRGDIAFLERLGEELTRPVLPGSAAVDYTPSQYLCEFVKHCGYHGVRYRSSVGDGVNLALFDPAHATILETAVHRVARVHVELRT